MTPTNTHLTIDQFHALCKAHKKIHGSAKDHVIYNWIRGLPLGRGFSKITNNTKLANGQNPSRSLCDALNEVTYGCRHWKRAYQTPSVFGVELTTEQVQAIETDISIYLTKEM
jgi:hypothetical protein